MYNVKDVKKTFLFQVLKCEDCCFHMIANEIPLSFRLLVSQIKQFEFVSLFFSVFLINLARYELSSNSLIMKMIMSCSPD